MKGSPIDDLFKTTFECPVPYCAKLYNIEEEAKDHIWTFHGTDDEPKLTFDSLLLENTPEYAELFNTEEAIIREQKEAYVIDEFSPDLMMSKNDPLLSQSANSDSSLETTYLPTDKEVLKAYIL